MQLVDKVKQGGDTTEGVRELQEVVEDAVEGQGQVCGHERRRQHLHEAHIRRTCPAPPHHRTGKSRREGARAEMVVRVGERGSGSIVDGVKEVKDEGGVVLEHDADPALVEGEAVRWRRVVLELALARN
jgi:hypothetical protein